MLKEVEEFERLFTKALSERNLEVLVQLFRPPLPVFYPDGIKVDSGFPDISDGLSFLLDGMKKAGIVKAESEIMKVERRKGTGTISYLVTTRMLNSAGEGQGWLSHHYARYPKAGHWYSERQKKCENNSLERL